MDATQSPISAEVRSFLESMRVPCVISTLRADGHPITSATWYGFLGADVVVSTPAARNKARNVRRDPRISFIVDTKAMPYRGVAIEGSADVLPDPDGAIIRAIVERYLGAEAAAAMLVRLDTRGERVILRIRAERVRPWAIEPAITGTTAEGGMT
jgi:PPOX class probable F420-dependent enzyme